MKTYLLLLALLVVVSCDQPGEITDKIFIDLSESVARSEDLSQEIDRIEFFQIESGTPIDKVDNIRMMDDKIIFLHKGGNYSSDVYGIIAIDESGKILWNYDKKGKGPGGFTNVFFMASLQHRKQIAFYDHDIKKVNFLNSDGEFVRSFAVDQQFKLFTELSNGQLVASFGKNSNRMTDEIILKHDLVFLDEDGKISEKFLPNTHNLMMGFNFGETLLPGNKQNIYTNTMQYTLFTITPEGVDSTWNLDFGEFNADTARYLHPKGQEDYLMMVESDEVLAFKAVHSEKHLWVLVPTDQALKLAVINKKNHSVYYYQKPEKRDFYYKGIPVPIFSLTQNADCFVYSLSALDAIEKWELLTAEEQSSSDPEWREIMENLDPESNPIICKLYAK